MTTTNEILRRLLEDEDDFDQMDVIPDPPIIHLVKGYKVQDSGRKGQGGHTVFGWVRVGDATYQDEVITCVESPGKTVKYTVFSIRGPFGLYTNFNRFERDAIELGPEESYSFSAWTDQKKVENFRYQIDTV